MPLSDSDQLHIRPNIIVLVVGVTLLFFTFFVDWTYVLKAAGLPAKLLDGERGRADMAILRSLVLVIAFPLVVLQFALWKNGQLVNKFCRRIRSVILAVTKSPFRTLLFLGTIVLMRIVLQLTLYLIGYRYYSADDFYRALKADAWLQNASFGQNWVGWLGLGSPWLPFSDYLFGLGLLFHRDIYITPKIVNVILSAVAVAVVYSLARALFGRMTALFTAILCCYQPWIVWLGISGMTSDLPSVIMITSFGLFLVRGLESNRPASLLAAACCLFVATGIRYENWFFSAVFSLFLVLRFILTFREGRLSQQFAMVVLGALAIANIYPVVHMAASYYVLGDFIPAIRFTDSFSEDTGKINLAVLAISAFPLEILSVGAGVALFLKTDERKSPRVYLLLILTSLAIFAAVFWGRLSINGSSPQRILLPYIILLLPFSGFLLAYLAGAVASRQHLTLAGCLILLMIGTFDIMRAFNYKNSNRDHAFAVGWTLRTLQQLEAISDDGRIVMEIDNPGPIIALANKPERFVLLDDGQARIGHYGGLHAHKCKKLIDGTFTMIILSSPEKVQAFQETFSGRTWQMGRYHIFEIDHPSKYAQTLCDIYRTRS